MGKKLLTYGELTNRLADELSDVAGGHVLPPLIERTSGDGANWDVLQPSGDAKFREIIDRLRAEFDISD